MRNRNRIYENVGFAELGPWDVGDLIYLIQKVVFIGTTDPGGTDRFDPQHMRSAMKNAPAQKSRGAAGLAQRLILLELEASDEALEAFGLL